MHMAAPPVLRCFKCLPAYPLDSPSVMGLAGNDGTWLVRTCTQMQYLLAPIPAFSGFLLVLLSLTQLDSALAKPPRGVCHGDPLFSCHWHDLDSLS
jgi:hypothetical protein